MTDSNQLNNGNKMPLSIWRQKRTIKHLKASFIDCLENMIQLHRLNRSGYNIDFLKDVTMTDPTEILIFCVTPMMRTLDLIMVCRMDGHSQDIQNRNAMLIIDALKLLTIYMKMIKVCTSCNYDICEICEVHIYELKENINRVLRACDNTFSRSANEPTIDGVNITGMETSIQTWKEFCSVARNLCKTRPRWIQSNLLDEDIVEWIDIEMVHYD